jgi:hypothetical protein
MTTGPTPRARPAAELGLWLIVIIVVPILVGSLLLAAASLTSTGNDLQRVNGATVSSGSVTTAAPDSTSCAKGRWPETVTGAPGHGNEGSGATVDVWFGIRGWYISTSASAEGHTTTIRGTVTSSGPVKLGDLSSKSAGDFVVASGNVVRFSLEAAVKTHGFSFVPGCVGRLTFEFAEGGRPLPTDRLFLGPRRRPLSNPFSIERVPAR